MPSTSRPLAMLCLSLILAGAALPWHRASALGLGEITTSSWLGAPFEAVIPLVVSPGELESVTAEPATVKVELGSPADYARLGAERTPLHLQLQISLEEHAGAPVIRLRTREPLLEPFLDLVLAVRMPQGRLVRGYTVLIDPPPALAATASSAVTPRVASVAAPATPVAPRSASTPTASHAATTTASPGAPSIAPRTASSAAPRAPLSLPAGTHLTRPGDSLWRIARDWSEGRSVNAAMDAIIAANPDAFIGGEPGRLREGITLTLPGALPAVVATDTPSPSPHVVAAGQARVEDTGTRLELVAPTAPAIVAPAYRGYQQRVEGINAAVAELADSVQHARARLERMDRELRGVMAAYDRQRDTMPAAAGAPVATATQVAASDAGLPRPTAAVAVTPLAGSETVGAEALQSFDFRPLGFGVALVALALGAAWSGWRWQRRQTAAAVDPAAAASFAAPASALIRVAPAPRPRDTAAAAGRASVGPASGEPPAVPVNGFTPIPTIADESVDPAISAGVYLAFGKLAEAEQLLTEALAQQPERYDLQLQLLDIYLQSGNGAAFEQLATALAHQFVDDQGVLDELSILQEAYAAAPPEPVSGASVPVAARFG